MSRVTEEMGEDAGMEGWGKGNRAMKGWVLPLTGQGDGWSGWQV